jgi:signal transduction histidine kinase/CheY-like chemotaxis protein
MLALAAGAVAAVVDHFLAFHLIDWVRFYFGPILHFLVALLCGPAAGAAAGAVGYTARYLEFGRPAGAIFPALDAYVIGWLAWRRGWRVLDAAALWALIKAIPLFASVRWGFGLDESESVVVVVQATANLLLNAAALQVMLHVWEALGLRAGGPGVSPQPLRFHLYSALSSSVVLCFLAAVAISGRASLQNRTDREGQQLRQSAMIVAASLDGWLEVHRAAVVAAAQSLEQINRPGRPLLGRVLAAVHKAHPGFITMIIADHRGVLATADPPVALDTGKPIGIGTTSVADREYFREPRRTGEPFVSGIFLGRGYFERPIVAVSAPVKGPDGRMAYLVEGTLELPRLAAIWKEMSPPGTDLVIADANGVAAFSSEAGGVALLQPITSSGLWQGAESGGPKSWYKFEAGTRSDPAVYVAARARSRHGWSVFVRVKSAVLRTQLARLYQGSAIWALVAVLLPLLLFSHLTRRVTRPIENLAAGLRDARGAGNPLPAPDPGMPKEVVELLAAFDQLWNRWQAADREKREALAALEDRVRARTAEMMRAAEAAEKASRAKSEFLAMMSHEIRTPLNGVLGMLQVIRYTELTKDQREHVDLAANSAELLLGVVGSVLDISKIEAGQLTLEQAPFELPAVFHRAAAIFSARAAVKGLFFDFKISGSLPAAAAGDSARLHQVLTNLLGNAVKFTDSGGVRLHAGWEAESAQAGRLRVGVEDTGTGIPEGAIADLFTPFVQGDASTTRRFGGTGLGLAIAKKLVNLMGGDITVTSAPGRGSKFMFWIPLTVADASTAFRPYGASEFAAGSLSGKRVLVVEDNPVNRRVAERMLDRLGITVQSAATGREALHLLQYQKFDLILMDCQMPEMDGYHTTAEIRRGETGARTPIVALTAHAMAGDREKCLRAGMDDYLSKPVDLERLRSILNQYLAKEQERAS